jgi:flagellar protein FlaG
MKVEAFQPHLTASVAVGRGRGGEGWQAKVAWPATQEAKPSQEVGLAEVEQAVKEINSYLQLVRRNLEFSVDKEAQRVVVKVIDAETGEVVRQIPPDAVLAMAKFLHARETKGLLLAQQA